MSARADNAARDLLARLTEEAALESAPIAEVRADLVMLGVDPARSIQFSRRLAGQAASPAADLLKGVLAAEDDDRDILALETADIAAVRADLSAAGSSVDAQTRRIAGKAAVMTERRRPRRLWYGLGGAVAALAASLLIFVNLSMREESQQVALAPAAEQPAALREELRQSYEVAGKAAEPAPSAPAADSAGAITMVGGNSSADETRTETAAASGLSADAEARREAAEALFAVAILPPKKKAEGVQAAPVAPLQDQRALADLTVLAALILQPELAPEPMRQADIGAGDLAGRLPEVAGLQMRDQAIALVTLQQADGTAVDGVVIRVQVGNLQMLRKSDSAAPREEAEPAQPVTPLGARPTLRQLLGEDGDDFMPSEIRPTGASEQN